MRVLTVDDSGIARRLIRRELEEAGYEVLEAASGEEALELLAKEPVHLVTLDVHMPGMDGYETCQRIRAAELLMDGEDTDGLQVIFVTADDTLAGRIAGFEAGAADFIVKPFASDVVRRAVDGLLRPPPADQALTALVAEDSPLVRRITCEALTQLGLSLVTTGDGAAAWKLLQRDAGAVDLVVSDYIMPRMNGDRLCRHIRSRPETRHLPVMVLSALDTPEYVETIIRAGATDFVPKPYVKEAFQSRVTEMLPGGAARKALRARLKALYGEARYARVLDRFSRPGADNAFARMLSHVDSLRDAAEAGMRGLPAAC